MSVHRKPCRDCGRPIDLRQGHDAIWRPYDRSGALHRCPGRPRSGAHRAVPVAHPAEEARATTAGRGASARAGVQSGFGERVPRTVAPWAFLLLGGLGLLLAWAVVPREQGSRFDLPSGVPAAAQNAPEAPLRTIPDDDACRRFSSQIWAQTVFDAAPSSARLPDLDGDGLVCEGLPPSAAPALWTTTMPADVEAVTLLETIDGDTITIRRADGAVERVRLIGVDTPETGLGSQPLECYGFAASRFTTSMLATADGEVYLERDVEERDRYDRLLRWVWFIVDERPYLANEAIVRAGAGERYRNTPNRRYLDRMVEAESFAQNHRYGQWATCG